MRIVPESGVSGDRFHYYLYRRSCGEMEVYLGQAGEWMRLCSAFIRPGVARMRLCSAFIRPGVARMRRRRRMVIMRGIRSKELPLVVLPLILLPALSLFSGVTLAHEAIYDGAG
jgi:hypothetical protein